MTLPAHLAGLLRPQAYPHPVERVEFVETHISWVLLAGEFAYKLKRPVRLPFLDFRDPARREALCREELRLNRRFAPELYLDVSVVTAGPDGPCIGGPGPVLEHAVRMRRFDRAEELDRLAAGGRIGEDELRAFGAGLAGIQRSLPRPVPGSPWLRAGRTRDAIAVNLRECAGELTDPAAATVLAGVAASLGRRLDAADAALSGRAATHVREGHGDLHAQNVVRRGGRLVAFDCLEFEPAFRWIDVADEVAFLFADLLTRGAAPLAWAFLGGWLEESGDFAACAFLDVLVAHRALVRAKVESIEARTGPPERRDARLARRDACLATAGERLAPRRPALALVCGPSGSGKTWLARQLAPAWTAVHLRSDVERRRLAGLGALERSGSGRNEGIYAPERTRETYERLEALAEGLLRAGFSVLLDATLLGRESRARYVRLAARLGVEAGILWCTAPPDVLRARVVARAVRADDASEAGPDVLRDQLGRMQPPAADEGCRGLVVDTTSHAARDRALAWLASLATARPAG